MIKEHLGKLNTLAKKIFAGITAKLVEVVHVFMPEAISAIPGITMVLVAAKGNVLDMGKRYRKTSGHAPLFSLFTFFKDSQ